MICLDEKRAEVRVSAAEKKLCHNCDTKPVFTVKTDFIDRTTLLILRNLLKTKVTPKIPAYMARPLLFNKLQLP